MNRPVVDDAVGVESAIAQVETLFQIVTGHNVPPVGDSPYAPIPAGVDAGLYVQDQADRLVELLDEMIRELPHPPFVPAMTMFATTDELLICIDLPGVARENVSLMFTPWALEITGERVGTCPSGAAEQWTDTPTGPFCRVVALPPNAIADEARATFRNGVIEIRLPLGSGATTPDV